MNPAIASILPTLDLARYRSRIRTELVATVCKRLPTLVAIEIVLTTAIIVSVIWDVATPAQMALWLAVHFAVVLSHAYTYFHFRKQPESSQLLQRLLAGGMALRGVYSAVLLAFMFNVIPDILYHLYMFLYAGVIAVVAVTLFSEDLITMAGYSAPLLLALSAMAFDQLQPRYVGLGAVGITTLVATLLLARTRQRGQADALALRFAVMDLAGELAEQRDAALRANTAKSSFLAAASHDLRQPLHALALLASAMQSSDLDEDTRGIVADIGTAVGSLDTMFAALLDVSRLDAGVLQPQLKHFHLGEFLQRLCGEYAAPAQAKHLQLSTEKCNWTAHTDPLLLEQVVRNYLANAVRYTHEGAIHVRCERIQAGICIEVADTGIGIAPEQQGQIFDEFYQVDNSERDRTKGLGLGLAICRRIAGLLGHPIGVESMPHRGSRFQIVVPVGDPGLIEIARASDFIQQQSFAELRVLVIDDDAAARDSMRTLLSRWQCRVAVAENATQAVTAARASFDCLDALIVDFRLRERRTGIEAISHLRAEFNADIPALIVSGDTAPERLREVADSGYTLVHKPLQAMVLRAFLLSALRAKKAGLLGAPL